MVELKVWLMVISSAVNGGEVTSVQPQMYPTAAACEQVGKNLPSGRSNSSYWTDRRCIQTTVLVPK